MNKKLYRDEYHKIIGGVCAGLAEYFEMDPTIVRLLFAFAFFVGGFGLIPYIVLWIVLPKKGFLYNNFNNPTVDYRVPPRQPGDPLVTPPPQQPESPYGSNPFADSKYGSSPYGSNPIQNVAPRQKSHAGIIVGAVLIIIGAAILVDNYDLIPDFDFERLWPGIFVIIGAALIVSGQAKQAWQKPNWESTEKKDTPADDVPPATDNNSTVES